MEKRRFVCFFSVDMGLIIQQAERENKRYGIRESGFGIWWKTKDLVTNKHELW